MAEAPRADERRSRYPFSGIPSLLRSPIAADPSHVDADVAVLGVPTDEGSPFMPGSRFGPRGIREHSLRFGERGYYDHRTGKTYLEHELDHRRVVDAGDVDVRPTDVEGTFDAVTAAMHGLLAAGALPVVLGGDHAITYPVVRAYERPLHVVHFDATSTTRRSGTGFATRIRTPSGTSAR